MALLRTLRSSATALALSALLLGGCVDSFGGSNIQVTLNNGVPTSADDGDTPEPGQAPFDTYMALWAVHNVYQTDADGNVMVDGNGNPIIEQSFAFELERFSLRPVIDQSSPCFIDLEEARYPGIHVTDFAARVHRDTGIGDPLTLGPDHGFPEGDVIDVLTADVRDDNLTKLENQVKAVTSFSRLQYPDMATYCVEDDASDPTPDLIPPPGCIDDESNARRLALCRDFWEQDELFYEGSDKVFTLPLNGKWRGAVSGMNPVSGVSLIGGANFFVDEVVADFAHLMINWQYIDHDGDGTPDYPAGFPEAEKSDIGYHFMSGTPIDKVRGVINVPLRHRSESQISGEAVIFPQLNEDNVQF